MRLVYKLVVIAGTGTYVFYDVEYVFIGASSCPGFCFYLLNKGIDGLANRRGYVDFIYLVLFDLLTNDHLEVSVAFSNDRVQVIVVVDVDDVPSGHLLHLVQLRVLAFCRRARVPGGVGDDGGSGLLVVLAALHHVLHCLLE